MLAAANPQTGRTPEQQRGLRGIGASSSRSTATSVRPYEVGIDTARILFRLKTRTQHALASAHLRYPVNMGGLRAGYVPTYELLWVEGRPAQLLGMGVGLLPPSGLPDATEAVRQQLATYGYTSAQQIGVSRLDATVSIDFGRPADGWAVLRGMDVLDAPRRITRTYHDGRRLQSVAKLTPKGQVMERIYDKGLECGVGAPGRLIRFEAQTRHKGDSRTTADWWTMERVRETFEKRFSPMARAADGLHVGSEQTIRTVVRQLVDEGKLGATQARTILGYLAAESVGIPASARTRRRQRAELRRLGLAHALDGAEDDVDVDLAAVLEDVLTAEQWRG